MPTYDYKCRACGATFERFQSIRKAPIRRCPSCGARKVHRLIGAGGGIIFRGSGFYQTDYRSEEYKSKSKAESVPAGTASAPDPAKPDASTKKPAGKHGSKSKE